MDLLSHVIGPVGLSLIALNHHYVVREARSAGHVAERHFTARETALRFYRTRRAMLTREIMGELDARLDAKGLAVLLPSPDSISGASPRLLRRAGRSRYVTRPAPDFRIPARYGSTGYVRLTPEHNPWTRPGDLTFMEIL